MSIEQTSSSVAVSPATRLSALAEADLPLSFVRAVGDEVDLSLTVGDVLQLGDGRSPVLAMLLALDAVLKFPGQEMLLGEGLPIRHSANQMGQVEQVNIKLSPDIAYAAEPAPAGELPPALAVVARWPGGRIRVVVGGYGPTPRLALDGKGETDILLAVKNAYQFAGEQADYLVEATQQLVQICLDSLA